jgi:tetratricopeptide (TPR) repeat protein
MKKLFTIAVAVVLFGCQEKAEKITDSNDYNQYLNTINTPSKDAIEADFEFWQKRFNNDSTHLMEMSRLSGIHAALFGSTGDISELKTSEALIKKSLATSARNKDTYLRSLAHNYIAQHRFKEAQVLLDSAYSYPDNRRETEMMLFDVAMELGNYQSADTLLGKIKNTKDFNYLIRLAKWSDQNGNLDAAIKCLEQAQQIAEERNNKGFKLWIYSNIGDFYGHAGRLKDSYNSYLKTLALEPDNHYVKKQIAWMVYSFEKNTEEANRILDSVMVNHKVPDYHLLKAEIATFNGNTSEANKQRKLFLTAAEDPNYGGMYNTYLINVYVKTAPEKALQLAETEVDNRATPETYQLLAYAQLKAGQKDAALKTIENYVEGQTSEPKALFHAALVYKANGMTDKVALLKEELLDASYELGPVTAKEIIKL